MASNPDDTIEGVVEAEMTNVSGANKCSESKIHSLDDADARHIADRAWFLSNPSLWPERQHLVVAVYNSAIVGQGPDYVEAFEAAQRGCALHSKPCPGKYDVTYIIVPDVVDPEPAADWDPLTPAMT
jgi:hypothetical protein